jgi:hypothetical protein
MTGSIEARYGRAFRWYPRAWRAKNQDAALSTLLDVAEGEGRTGPKRSELVSLAANGLAARVGAVVPASVRDPAASFALATGAAFAFVMFAGDAWMRLAQVIGLSYPGYYPRPEFFSEQFGVDLVIYGPWIVASLLAMLNRRGAARIVLGVELLASVAVALQRLIGGPGWAGPMSTTIGFLFLLGLIAIAGSPARRRTLGLQGSVALLVFAGLSYGGAAANGGRSGLYLGDHFFWDLSGSDIRLIVALLAVFLVVAALALVGKGTAAGILSVSAVPWLAVLLVSLSTDGVGDWALALFIVGGLLVFGVLLAAFRRSSYELVLRRRGSPSE